MKVTTRVISNRFPQMAAAAKRGVRSGLERARGPILAGMQGRTPVDTGELRESESAEVTSDTTLTFRAGTDHALWVHQGTRRMPARRFMAEAIEAGEPLIVASIAEGIRSELG